MRLVVPLLLLPHAAHAAIFAVGPGQPYATISDAVDDAHDGDLITLDPGTYDELVEIRGKDVTISALGIVEWTGRLDNLLRVDESEVTVLGVVFHPSGGRAIRLEDAILHLVNAEVSGNRTGDQPYNGAAIAAYDGSTLDVANCRFADNRSEPDFFQRVSNGYGGHIYLSDSDATIDGSALTGGEAVYGGAIIHVGTGTLTITDSTLTGNVASDRGGALYIDDEPSLRVERSTLSDNSAGNHGGALRWSGADRDATVSFVGCALSDNSAGTYGGAIAVNVGGELELLDNTFIGNSAGAGGAVSAYDVPSVRVRRNTFCNNTSSGEAGALRLYALAQSTLTNNVFTHNTASGRGGAIYVLDGAATVTNNDLLDSSAGNNAGGAMWIEDADVVARNNLIGWTRRGSGLEGNREPDEDWSDLWSNSPRDLAPRWTAGASTLSVDPLLAAYTPDDVCDDDDLHLGAGSPLIDAGDPTILDPDHSRSDIGAFGGPEAPASLWVDDDRDGSIAAYDCDDDDPLVHPGAVERCDGIDNDCNGQIDAPNVPGAPTWYPDRDGDGFGNDAAPIQACAQPPGTVDLGGDCDDRNRDVLPGADEVCDGRDNNCDGSADGPDAIDQLTWYADHDDDGYGTPSSSIGSCQPVGGYALSDADCDDGDPAISPVADERCDHVDNNCDGLIDGDDAVDPRTWYPDGDGDGWGATGPGDRLACDRPEGAFSRTGDDCDDADPAVHPLADESCTDPVDLNCDGSVGQQDLDGDGWAACEDCDDQDATSFPGADDPWYDGEIHDCDRTSDFDADADGYDALEHGGDDCDDQDAGVNPGATERADDAIDNDCDGVAATDAYLDEDLRAGCGGCASTSRAPGGAALALAWLLARRRDAAAQRG